MSEKAKYLSEYPKLIKEWHPTKNGDLSPSAVLTGSSKKVWWQCSKGDDHEWMASPSHRTREDLPTGCPFCSGRKIGKDNSLQAIYPEIAAQWHPTKNEGLLPTEVAKSSNRRVWWKCDAGPDHEWETSVNSRTRKSKLTGCPYCSNQRVSETNCLSSTHPHIAEEWDADRNFPFTPSDVIVGSNKQYWWRCKLDPSHVWFARVYSRTSQNTGCPFCSNQTSSPEIRLFCELKIVFGQLGVRWRHRINKTELDVFIEDLALGVEYDGARYHSDIEKDKRKNSFFAKKGILIVRVRERPLLKISDNDVCLEEKILTKSVVNQVVSQICVLSGHTIDQKIRQYLDQNYFQNDSEFRRYLSYIPSPPPEYSLAITHPDIARLWNHRKNSPLKPENFMPQSNKKVWWICSFNPNHEWETPISHLSRGNGCPICAGQVLSTERSLEQVAPHIASEWHPSKNGNITPKDVFASTPKRFWWKCPEGDDHEWETSVNNRFDKGSGCPFCSGKRASSTNNLYVANPILASQWHSSLNGDLLPSMVTPKSPKRVWWQCTVDSSHHWEASIKDRARAKSGGRCPICTKAKSKKV